MRALAIVMAMAGVVGATPRELAVVDGPAQQHAFAVKVLYLDRCRGGCTITRSSDNDARLRQSSLPRGSAQVELGEFGRSDAAWNAMVQCVREVYSPYAIEVTDVEPASGVVYNAAIVAGTARELGWPDSAAGVAQLADDCSPYSNVLTFVFANNDTGNWLCWAVAQETGHAFGLDHSYSFEDGSSACRDPMSYASDCGPQRFFRPEAAKCGEWNTRSCRCGTTQSTHFQLLGVLGPGTPITAPPEIILDAPIAGEQLGPAPISIRATAQRGVALVELWINNSKWWSSRGNPFATAIGQDPRYEFALPHTVPDGVLDLVVHAEDDLGIATNSPVVTVTKGEPCVTAETCLEGQRCDERGRCLWDRPVGEFGDPCAYPQYCKSGVCANGTCTQGCDLDDTQTCPNDFECAVNFPDNLCLPGEPGGCCSGGGAPSPVVALVLLLLRRRRSYE